MSDWKSYYEKTKDNPVHPALKFAQSRVRSGLPKIAVDCGCGAGRNVGYLRSEGFEVHAFDVDSGAIDMCIQQFGDDANAHFSCESFLSFDYPSASLIAATFSLFFCPATEFEESWKRIGSSLMPGGVFVGTFLGPNDTWVQAGSPYNVISHSIDEVRSLFVDFEIEGMDEKNYEGTTALGAEKRWHTFTVTAVKRTAT